ncbi:hypothetical protein OBBRIDRAFT_836740 [Obba rivulosa]|uniref:Uncharacterized protein n=1 Tax=Obba rivulosa TaxID=1052685 RepID=A0A8E2ANZ4_9APHY|nr:hypothetical protein OBBRIDRAFT_836740 [Obba rivulosa]
MNLTHLSAAQLLPILAPFLSRFSLPSFLTPFIADTSRIWHRNEDRSFRIIQYLLEHLDDHIAVYGSDSNEDARSQARTLKVVRDAKSQVWDRIAEAVFANDPKLCEDFAKDRSKYGKRVGARLELYQSRYTEADLLIYDMPPAALKSIIRGTKECRITVGIFCQLYGLWGKNPRFERMTANAEPGQPLAANAHDILFPSPRCEPGHEAPIDASSGDMYFNPNFDWKEFIFNASMQQSVLMENPESGVFPPFDGQQSSAPPSSAHLAMISNMSIPAVAEAIALPLKS